MDWITGGHFIAKIALAALHELVQPGSQQKLACFFIRFAASVKGI